MEVQDKHHRVSFASVSGKPVEAVFDGGVLTSDIGLMLLRQVESKIGILSRIVEALTDRRHPSYVDHTIADLISQRVFQIACGYEDANDCNALRRDPAFKAACDRLPISGAPLASQPTTSRLENGIRRRDLYRIAQALVDGFIASYDRPPEAVVLDIDDTDDEVHGNQQLSLFNGYYDERCYMPLHIYEGQTGRLITTLLRPGARPSGKQIVSILKRLAKALREAWGDVQIFLRGDGHFSCPEVHDFCDEQEVYFVLGQAGNTRLAQRGHASMEQAKATYRETGQPVQRFTSFAYQARPVPGHRQDASSTKLKSPLRGKPMHALSSPTWKVASPHSSTKPSIARAAGWKTSSRITKPFSTPIVPLVTRLKPITSVSSSIVPLMS